MGYLFSYQFYKRGEMMSLLKNIAIWIWDNKTWLFSGIGITILAVLVLLFKRIVKKKNTNKNAHENTPDDTPSATNNSSIDIKDKKYHNTPTLKEIKDEINSHSLYQQEEIIKNYIGLKIHWQLKLSSVFKRNDNSVILSCVSQGGHPGDVEIITNVMDYPIIKIIKEGHSITVKGEIKEFHHQTPVIKPVEIIFE